MRHQPGELNHEADGRLFVWCSCGAKITESGLSSASVEMGDADERADALHALFLDHATTDGLVEPPAIPL